MKKFICCLLLVLCLCLNGCGTEYGFHADDVGFDECGDYDGLYYNINTKIIYYIFNDGDGYKGFGYMAPYISEHGYFCKWDDNQIIEIKN